MQYWGIRRHVVGVEEGANKGGQSTAVGRGPYTPGVHGWGGRG